MLFKIMQFVIINMFKNGYAVFRLIAKIMPYLKYF